MQNYKVRYNNVILIGDTHSTDITNQLLKKKIPSGLDVVHIGDGGWGFGEPSFAIDNAVAWAGILNKTCQNLNITLYHIIGNHDNPEVWKFPNFSNLIFVQTGDVIEFHNGKKALCIGGGISIDRYTRKLGKDYWRDEVTPQLDEVTKTDYVFSHDAPEYFNHSSYTIPKHWSWYNERDVNLLDDAIAQRKVVEDIVKRSEAKLIIGGHFHNNIQQEIDGVKYRCLDINELYDFKAE
jgi:DNA repair exonuclease SbcCD nuclease subunit